MGAPKTDTGKLYVCIWPTEGSTINQISHDWCDPTTWYTNSSSVTEEVAEDSGDHKTYNLDHINIIDINHGKMSEEDYMPYPLKVWINDVLKTEVDAHTLVGDFLVDHRLGKLTFGAELDPSDVVKCSYYYATDSTWILKPNTGKILKIKKVEVQFSKNVILTDTITFTVYAGGQQAAPSKHYKNVSDFTNDANGSFPAIAAFGGTGWRGAKEDIYVYQWDYSALTGLDSRYGVEIRIKLQHDTPYISNNANRANCTASFYCLNESIT